MVNSTTRLNFDSQHQPVIICLEMGDFKLYILPTSTELKFIMGYSSLLIEKCQSQSNLIGFTRLVPVKLFHHSDQSGV